MWLKQVMAKYGFSEDEPMRTDRRIVSSKLRVTHKRQQYSVCDIEGIRVGHSVTIGIHPLPEGYVIAIITERDGSKRHHKCPLIPRLIELNNKEQTECC